MLPGFMLRGIHTIRDQWTLNKTCEIKQPVRSPDGRGGENVTWATLGFWLCRIDAMESGTTPQPLIDTTKRAFGFTLPADAPRLGIGWTVVINDVEYLVEKAHDFDAEQIIRRYDVSITEADWTKRAQDDSVRDDDWAQGTADANISMIRMGINTGGDYADWDQWTTAPATITDGDIETGEQYEDVGLRFEFIRPQMVGSVSLVLTCQTYVISAINGYLSLLDGFGDGVAIITSPILQTATDGTQRREITIPFDPVAASREFLVLGVGAYFPDDNSVIVHEIWLNDPAGVRID